MNNNNRKANIMKIKNKKSRIILISIPLFIFIVMVYILKKSYSHENIYDWLGENTIIVGNEIFKGNVNPNSIANAAIDYYIESENENIKIYKYSGLDENNVPIWGTYSDETNSYIEISSEEIKIIEEILTKKYEKGLSHE